MFDPYEDLEEVMQEPASGHNHGRMDGFDLDTESWQAYDVRYEGGFGINTEASGHLGTKGNPRGTALQAGEYVDADELERLVTTMFGWTYSQIHYIYGHKHLTLPEDKELKAEMDAAFLEIYEAGGNIGLLAQALGMSRQTIDRAVKRARKVREES